MDDKLIDFFNGLSDDEKLELSRNGRYKISAVKDISSSPAVIEVVDTEDNSSARVRVEEPVDFQNVKLLVNITITDIETNKTRQRIESMKSFVPEGGLTQSDLVYIIVDKLAELGAKSAYMSGRFATECDVLDNFEQVPASFTAPNDGVPVSYPFGTITTKDGNKITVNVYTYLLWNDSTVYYK